MGLWPEGVTPPSSCATFFLPHHLVQHFPTPSGAGTATTLLGSAIAIVPWVVASLIPQCRVQRSESRAGQCPGPSQIGFVSPLPVYPYRGVVLCTGTRFFLHGVDLRRDRGWCNELAMPFNRTEALLCMVLKPTSRLNQAQPYTASHSLLAHKIETSAIESIDPKSARLFSP